MAFTSYNPPIWPAKTTHSNGNFYALGLANNSTINFYDSADGQAYSVIGTASNPSSEEIISCDSAIIGDVLYYSFYTLSFCYVGRYNVNTQTSLELTEVGLGSDIARVEKNLAETHVIAMVSLDYRTMGSNYRNAGFVSCSAGGSWGSAVNVIQQASNAPPRGSIFDGDDKFVIGTTGFPRHEITISTGADVSISSGINPTSNYIGFTTPGSMYFVGIGQTNSYLYRTYKNGSSYTTEIILTLPSEFNGTYSSFVTDCFFDAVESVWHVATATNSLGENVMRFKYAAHDGSSWSAVTETTNGYLYDLRYVGQPRMHMENPTATGIDVVYALQFKHPSLPYASFHERITESFGAPGVNAEINAALSFQALELSAALSVVEPGTVLNISGALSFSALQVAAGISLGLEIAAGVQLISSIAGVEDLLPASLVYRAYINGVEYPLKQLSVSYSGVSGLSCVVLGVETLTVGDTIEIVLESQSQALGLISTSIYSGMITEYDFYKRKQALLVSQKNEIYFGGRFNYAGKILFRSADKLRVEVTPQLRPDQMLIVGGLSYRIKSVVSFISSNKFSFTEVSLYG